MQVNFNSVNPTSSQSFGYLNMPPAKDFMSNVNMYPRLQDAFENARPALEELGQKLNITVVPGFRDMKVIVSNPSKPNLTREVTITREAFPPIITEKPPVPNFKREITSADFVPNYKEHDTKIVTGIIKELVEFVQ